MGPLMIEITDRHELVMHTRDLWSRLTVEERQEVIADGPVAPRVIKAEWRELTPEELHTSPENPVVGPVTYTGKPLVRPMHLQGFKPTGDVCDHCFSPNMVRTGTCLTCQDCGTPSGGCS